jgi:hypothetical protein
MSQQELLQRLDFLYEQLAAVRAQKAALARAEALGSAGRRLVIVSPFLPFVIKQVNGTWSAEGVDDANHAQHAFAALHDAMPGSLWVGGLVFPPQMDVSAQVRNKTQCVRLRRNRKGSVVACRQRYGHNLGTGATCLCLLINDATHCTITASVVL